MVLNTVFNMVHTIGEFLCLKCVENILKKHFEIFDMVLNTVFNMVHTIGEFLCLKCVENILKKHFENFRMF